MVVLILLILLLINMSSAEGEPGEGFFQIGPPGAWFASIAFDPSDKSGNTVYLGHDDGGGLYKSSDGGRTLDCTRPLAFQNVSAWALAIGPDGAVYAGDSYGYGVYKSMDGGKSWEFKNSGLAASAARAVRALLVDPVDPQMIYAFSSDGLYRSTDFAESWRKLDRQPDLAGYAVSMVMASDGSALFVGDITGRVYVTTDRGITWSLLQDFGSYRPAQPIADLDIDESDGTINLYVTTQQFQYDPLQTTDLPVRIYRGIFADGRWPATPYLTEVQDIKTVEFAQLEISDGIKYLGVWGRDGNAGRRDNGAVWRSINDGEWERIADGPRGVPRNHRAGWRLIVDPQDRGHLFYSTFQNLFQTRNADATPASAVEWQETNYNCSTTYAAGLAADPQGADPARLRLYAGLIKGLKDSMAAGMDNLYTSTDGGSSWSVLVNFLWNPLSLSIHPATPGTLIAGTFSSGIKRSMDFGQTWAPTYVSGQVFEAAYAITTVFHPAASAPYNRQAFAAVQSPKTMEPPSRVGGIYFSSDLGINWTRILDVGNPNYVGKFNHVTVSPTNPNILYAAGEITSEDMRVRVEGGVWVGRTTDQGRSWGWTNKGPQGLEGTTVAQDPINSDILYCGTKRGLYKSTNGGTTWARIDRQSEAGPYIWQGEVVGILFRSPDDILVILYAADTNPVQFPQPTPGLWRSTNAGRTWTRLSGPPASGPALPTDNFVRATFLPPRIPNFDSVLLMTTYGGGVYWYNLPP